LVACALILARVGAVFTGVELLAGVEEQLAGEEEQLLPPHPESKMNREQTPTK
jgi:hypothetical protein